MKHRYKLYYTMAGLIGASLITTGIFAAMATNKKNSKNDAPAPDNQITNETPTLDEATQNRIHTMATIYNFVDKMNSIKALTVDDKTLMFTMEEGSALYVNLNNLTREEFCNLYGNSEANYEDIKSNFESAMLKLRLYFARSTQTSCVSDILNDEACINFFSNYEEMHVDYNNLSPEDRKDDAKDIIAQFTNDYIDGSNLPYNNVNPGLARLVLATFQEGDQIGWANSSVKFPKDINTILEDTIEPDLCRTTDNNLEDLVDSLEISQIANEVVNGTTTENENSYASLLDYFVAILTANGHYASVEVAIDANNSDIYNNNNGKTSGSSEESNDKSDGKKTKEASGKGLSSDDMDEETDGLTGNLKDSAEDQKNAIDKKYEDEKIVKEKKAAKFKKGYEHTYNVAYDSAFSAGIKLQYISSSSKDIYNLAYFDGYNKGIDDGYADGMRDRKKTAEVTPTITPTPAVTPTPGATTGTSSNDSNSSTNTDNGTTVVPSLGDGVQIENGYIDENGDLEFDGPIYDKDGNIVGKSNIRQNAINVLFATRDAIIATACINDSSYNEARAKKL